MYRWGYSLTHLLSEMHPKSLHMFFPINHLLIDLTGMHLHVPSCVLAQSKIWRLASNWVRHRFGVGSKPMTINFSGMNIYLPVILKLGRYQGFDPQPFEELTISALSQALGAPSLHC